MRLVVDAQSPVPLYHQIAEAIRYRVATGALQAGVRLPSVRSAAGRWGVHFHTVRRAYAVLAEQGFVEIRRPGGTTVRAISQSRENRSLLLPLHRDLADFLKRIRKKHGISAKQVSDLILSLHSSEGSRRPTVAVVECNMPQAEDYARQLESAWAISAQAVTLNASGDPPPGPILATYFHYNEVRSRWADRLNDIHFVAVQPDPSLPTQLFRFARTGRRKTVILGETNEGRAMNILPDLRRLLAKTRFQARVEIAINPATLFAEHRHTPVLLAPRLWAQLDEEQKRSAYAVELRYVLQAGGIEALASRLGWRRRAYLETLATSA